MLHKWEKYQDSHRTLWFRADAANDLSVAEVSKWNTEEDWHGFVSDIWSCKTATAEACMNRCDAKLRELGFALEDGE